MNCTFFHKNVSIIVCYCTKLRVPSSVHQIEENLASRNVRWTRASLNSLSPPPPDDDLGLWNRSVIFHSRSARPEPSPRLCVGWDITAKDSMGRHGCPWRQRAHPVPPSRENRHMAPHVPLRSRAIEYLASCPRGRPPPTDHVPEQHWSWTERNENGYAQGMRWLHTT